MRQLLLKKGKQKNTFKARPKIQLKRGVIKCDYLAAA